MTGSHVAIYEAYYHQVDPNNVGRIEATETAKFIKKAQLTDIIQQNMEYRRLPGQIGMFLALKSCAFAQAGYELNIANVNLDVPHQKWERSVIPKKSPAVPPAPIISSITNGDWVIKSAESIRSDRLFDSLQPANGYYSSSP